MFCGSRLRLRPDDRVAPVGRPLMLTEAMLPRLRPRSVPPMAMPESSVPVISTILASGPRAWARACQDRRRASAGPVVPPPLMSSEAGPPIEPEGKPPDGPAAPARLTVPRWCGARGCGSAPRAHLHVRADVVEGEGGAGRAGPSHPRPHSEVFGIGWGLSGLCPGPAVAALATGAPPILLFVPAMLIGMAAFRLAQVRRG